jgi:MFS family permease
MFAICGRLGRLVTSRTARQPAIASRSCEPRSLWTDRNFTIFWSVQTLSVLGNAFALVALPLLILRATGSVAQMGLLTAVAGVASIITGLFAGLLVDRVDRRRLMMLCDAARAVLYGLIPVCWAISPQVWLLYVVMALASVFDMIFRVAYVAAVVNLVHVSQIVSANGKMETTNAIAYIVGPMLAGLVSAGFGPAAAIGVNGASFAISLAGLAVIRMRRSTETVDSRGWHDLRAGFLAGFGFLWRTPVLRALTVLLTVVSFLTLGMIDILIYYMRDGLGQGERTVGIVLGIAGAGTVLGAALTSTLRRRLGFGVCWLASYVVCGVAVFVVGMSSNVGTVGAMVFAYSFGLALAGICSMSLRQQLTPDHLLGRVTSAFWTIHTSVAPIGAAVLTAVVDHVGVRTPLIWVSVAFLVVVVVAAMTPIRQREPSASGG